MWLHQGATRASLRSYRFYFSSCSRAQRACGISSPLVSAFLHLISEFRTHGSEQTRLTWKCGSSVSGRSMGTYVLTTFFLNTSIFKYAMPFASLLANKKAPQLVVRPRSPRLAVISQLHTRAHKRGTRAPMQPPHPPNLPLRWNHTVTHTHSRVARDSKLHSSARLRTCARTHASR